jgi:hypothetical protein
MISNECADTGNRRLSRKIIDFLYAFDEAEFNMKRERVLHQKTDNL